jgi:hypothetical protein
MSICKNVKNVKSLSYQDDIDGCAETADCLHLQDSGLQLLSVGQPEQHQGHRVHRRAKNSGTS